MSSGLTQEDARLIAEAFLEAIQADGSTAENAKKSVGRILEGAGAGVLADKVKKTDSSVWSSMWSSIKEFFVDIWEGVVGAAEALFEIITEWLL